MKSKEEYNAYMRVYLAKRYQKRRAWALTLLGGKCVSCGSRDLDNLQFDHKDPSTVSFRISERWLTSLKTLEKELAKCQLLCRFCHYLKTLQDTGKTSAFGTHGTLSSYRHCKCDICKAAKSAHSKAAYIKRKTALTS